MDRVIDFELLEKVIMSEREVVVATLLALDRLEKIVGIKELNKATTEMVEKYKVHTELLKTLQSQMYAPEISVTVMD